MKFVIYVIFAVISLQGQSTDLNWFVTGELHGSLDGEGRSMGGIYGIQNVLSSIRFENDFLFDAGGFTASGIYDLNTGGRRADSIRSEDMWRTLSLLNYTAITLGDDDLFWGDSVLAEWQKKWTLPLVSANIRSSKLEIEPFFRRSNTLISAVTTQKVIVAPNQFTLEDPLVALKKIAEVKQADELFVVLAHLELAEIDTLVRLIPEIDIVVRGHRNSSAELMETVGSVPVLSFGFQGRTLLKFNSIAQTAKMIPIPADGEFVIDSLQEVFDLYVMSGCHYGSNAIKEMLTVQEKNDKIEWNLYFAGTIDSGIRPGLENGSMQSEMIHGAIASQYPNKWRDFLWLCYDQEYSTDKAIAEMKLDPVRIEKWIEEKGEGFLETHYRRAERLGVTASPTLFINNREYEGVITAKQLGFALCKSGNGDCSSYGECLSDDDCEAGVCIEEGIQAQCKPISDPTFTIIQILPDDTVNYKSENGFTETTRSLFPSVEIETLRERNAKSILDRYSPERLPFMLMDTTITETYRFGEVDSGIVRDGNYYRFKSGVMEGNYYRNRLLDSGSKKLFVAVDSDLFQSVLSEISDIEWYPFLQDWSVNSSEKIEEYLKALDTTISVDSYMNDLRGVFVSTPVFILYDNRRVEEIDSRELFRLRLEEW